MADEKTLIDKYLYEGSKLEPITINTDPPKLACGGHVAITNPSQSTNVTVEGDLTVKGKIINEPKKEETLPYITRVDVMPGHQMVLPLRDGTILNIVSPAVEPEKPVNVYDWTISLPIFGTILLWAIFATIWKGYQKEEYERSFPQMTIDIPMPKVKPPLVPPPQKRPAGCPRDMGVIK